MRVMLRSVTCNVCVIMLMAVCLLMRLWNLFVPLRSTPFTRQYLPDTIILTRICLANTWVDILQDWVFRGTNLSVWVAKILKTMTNASVCRCSHATLAKKLTALAACMVGLAKRCLPPFGKAITPKKTTWAM